MVLGVAAVVCVSSAVAGELMQDFKAGYILGGTPRNIQIVELIAVVVASLVMYFPLYILQVGNIKSGGTGFGDPKLAAPQAGLMAALAQGIVGGEMAWPLVVTGAIFGVVLIMFKVRSPMLVAVGMYLPFPTTFAIFVGGMLRWITDWRSRAAQTQRSAADARRERRHPDRQRPDRGRGADRTAVRLFQVQRHRGFEIFKDPSYVAGFVVLLILGFVMVRVAALERRTSGRSRATVGDDVNVAAAVAILVRKPVDPEKPGKPSLPDTEIADPAFLERLRSATELLEAVAANRALLDRLPIEDRDRLHQAVAEFYNPDPVARRRNAESRGARADGRADSARRCRARRDRNSDAAAEAGVHHAQCLSARRVRAVGSRAGTPKRSIRSIATSASRITRRSTISTIRCARRARSSISASERNWPTCAAAWRC